MPKAVERDVLPYPGRLYPVFEIEGKDCLCQPLEHLTLAALTAQRECFIRQRQHCFRPCLLGDDVHAPAAVSSSYDVLPLQTDDVADAQPRKAGEQRGTPYDRLLARGLGKHPHLFKRQELAPCAVLLRVFQPWGDILLDASFLVGDAENAFQLVKVVVGGRSHHLALCLSGERQQVGKESLAVFQCQIIEGAASAAILFKMLVGGVPVPEIVVVSHL